MDLYNQKVFTLANIEILVLDEADRMLDMSFLKNIKKIIAMMPAKRPNLLFSATFSKEIKVLVNGMINNPILVEATPQNSTADKVDQIVYRVGNNAHFSR